MLVWEKQDDNNKKDRSLRWNSLYFAFQFTCKIQSGNFLFKTMYAIKPTIIVANEPPMTALLFVFPIKKHTIKIMAPIAISIKPKFFNKPFIRVYFL